MDAILKDKAQPHPEPAVAVKTAVKPKLFRAK